MRRPLIIGVLATFVLLGVIVAATIVLAGKDSGKIAKGITIGSVDVGGLTPAQASARLHEQLVAPLQRDILVRHDKKTFGLGAKSAGVRVDIDAMVDEAMDRSKDGNLISRAVRHATGGEVKATLPLQVTYREAAVKKLVDRVESSINRPAKDAKVSYTASGLGEVSGQTGRVVRADALQAKIDHALQTPGVKRSIGARTVVTKPKVTRDQLAKRNPVILVVSRSEFKLKLYKDLKLAKSYSVAIGMQGLETPAGLYHIQNKAVNPAWSVPYSAWTGSLAGTVVPGGAPNNPIKARWLGIFNGAGIHGVDPSEYGSIGHAASHGCVRMRIEDVIDLYPQVPVQAPIYIN